MAANSVPTAGSYPRKHTKREAKAIETAMAGAAAADGSSTQTLTNKTIDGDLNTIQDLAVGCLKTVAASADKIIAFATTTGVPGAVAVTGDVTMTGLGVTAIGANKVKPAMVAAADGAAGTVLTTNGAGQMSFAAQSFLQSSVTVSMTQAEIVGMFAAPKQLIAAPAAGDLIIVDSIEILHTYANAAYGNGGAVVIQHDATVNGAGPAIFVPATATITGAASSYTVGDFTALSIAGGLVMDAAALAARVGKSVCISNAAGAFNAGDAANIVKIRLKYRTVTPVA